MSKTSTHKSKASTNKPTSSAVNNNIKVEFPTEGNFPLRIKSARIHQEAGMHDVAELVFRGRLAANTKRLSTGTPVKITWSSPGRSSVWTGYVHHTRPGTMDLPAETTVVAIGATYVLKDSVQKVYRNSTADQIVSKIARANGLKANTERHPRVFTTASNTGQSEWQMMRRLAQQTGFALVSDNTTVRFMSKDALYKHSLTKGNYFSWGAPTRGIPSVLSVKARVADGAPELAGAVVNRVVSGIHGQKGVPIKTSHRSIPGGGSGGVRGAVK